MLRYCFFILVTIFFVGTVKANCLKGNCIDGYGVFVFKSGARYEGLFVKGQIHGQGTLIMKNGDRYTGDWKQNRRHGKGTYWFQNGNTYQGTFISGKMQGEGRMIYQNGSVYEGAWADNEPHGEGSMTYPDESVYTGEYVNGKRHGQGTMYYADGRIYKGSWHSGKRHGKGILYPHEGAAHSGTWHEGELINVAEKEKMPLEEDQKDCSRYFCHEEKGRLTFADGSVYFGEFVQGKPEGQGVCQYADGSRYEGGWSGNAPQGMGILYLVNGTKMAREWHKGRAIGPWKKSGKDDEVIQLPPDPGEVRIFALLIGISRYDHMPSLKFTDDDAYRLFAFFKSPEGGALPDEQLSILIDETATRKRILNELGRLSTLADQNDVLLVYFSGHGLQGSFLPFDFDGFHNLLAHRDIMTTLKKSNARQKLVLADACHSGGMPYYKGINTIELAPFYKAFLHSGGGTALFLSSRADEVSLEDQSLRQGIFSHFLIRGLKGEADENRNRLVDLDELSDFVIAGVLEYTNGRQHPILHGDIDTKVPLAFIRQK